jgi:mono/diheme cytochrome c family protein
MLLVIAGLAIALSGCSTGAYPLDIFPEMHYQQSYRAQEGPRIEAPIDSVPQRSNVNGLQGKPVPVDLGTAGSLKNPVANTPDNVRAGTQLFQRNCMPCHGPEGKGDGKLVQYFKAGKDNKTADGTQLVPIDLTGPLGRALAGGEGTNLYTIISNGGQGQWMPPFKGLLTEEERWLIILAVKNLQAQNPPPTQ